MFGFLFMSNVYLGSPGLAPCQHQTRTLAGGAVIHWNVEGFPGTGNWALAGLEDGERGTFNEHHQSFSESHRMPQYSQFISSDSIVAAPANLKQLLCAVPLRWAACW